MLTAIGPRVGPAQNASAPPNSSQAVSRIARAVVRVHFKGSCASDNFRVVCGLDAVRVSYVAAGVCISRGEVTTLDMRCHFDCREMWIAELHVAAPFRSRGFGADLAVAAESIASMLGIRTVHVFPLAAAKQFWLKLGYVPHGRKARVLVKRLGR
jgi:GNAT superfamily N-acetyltransferase